ncbi:MAG TPA: anti-sigma factor family protein [Candidatus Hypogeohydataceae bacterium YC38]|nr:zf-HC2 domain-containing protein [Candidatus Brocadiales bacterium]
MNCNEVRQFINLFLDSELDARSTLEVSEHLSACESCSRRFTQERKIEGALTSIFSQEAPSTEDEEERVWKSIFSRIRMYEKRRNRGLYMKYSIPIAVGISAFVLITIFNYPRHIDLALEANRCHTEYVENELSPNIETFSEEAVLGYFSGKLDFNLCLPKISRKEIKLVGARSCYLKKVHVAYLMYNYSGVPLSLFIFRDEDLKKFPSAEKELKTHKIIEDKGIRGNNFVAVKTNGAVACAVSEVDLPSLKRIIKGFEERGK